MTDLLTISEYSKARGCSVSAVYKRLKSPSNKIHDFVVKEDGQTFLKAEILDFEGLRRPDPTPAAVDLEKDVPNDPPSNTPPETVEEVEKRVEEGVGALAIKVLEQQLAQKDKVIEELNRRLEDAAKHEREMSDRMSDLLAQANELQRNNQILLAQAQQPKLIEAAPAPEPDPVEPAEEPNTKLPWYKKLFGR